jgi:hypothetical protein
MTAAMRRPWIAFLAAMALAAGCSNDSGESPMARNDASNAAPGSTATSAAVASPSTAPSGTGLGTTLTTPEDNAVTVFRVEMPAEPDEPLTTELDAGAQLAAVEGEFCAAGGEAVRAVSEADFFLVTADEQLLSYLDATMNAPRFPASQTAAPSSCIRGWVGFAVPEGDRIVAVRWDVNGTGGGPFLEWQVA